jgi:hypothetical protein
MSSSSNQRPADPDALDRIERNFIAGAIIELCGARTFMRAHDLRILQDS